MTGNSINFEEEILTTVKEHGLEFPGLDDQNILDILLPQAEEWACMRIVDTVLSEEDRALFRDAYAVSPEHFSAYDFLAERIENVDEHIIQNFYLWLDQLKAGLTQS